MRNDGTMPSPLIIGLTIILMLVLMSAYQMGKTQQISETVVDCTHLGKFRSHGKTFECKEIHR